MKIILALFASLLLFASAHAQSTIKGQIVDKVSGTPLDYATIVNARTQAGTITDSKGYFQLDGVGAKDTIVVSYVGYSTYQFIKKANQEIYKINLAPSSTMLTEIVVTPKVNEYLYDLIIATKKNQPKASAQAKSYYQLKSFIDNQQSELVECFYNADLQGYDVEELYLKTGRLGLQRIYENFFLNTETSKVIAMLQIMETQTRFPHTPFDFGKRRLMKRYELQLNNRYENEEQDSVYVIGFQHKYDDKAYFKGQVWINQTDLNLIKIELLRDSTLRHPFFPLFDTDKIKGVDLHLIRTFEEREGSPFFKQVNFKYNVRYLSRGTFEYEVASEAILYNYVYDDAFQLPKFSLEGLNYEDYRAINGMPYNTYFWEHNEEFQLIDYDDQNRKFYEDSLTFTNQTVFNPSHQFTRGLLQHPYLVWSKDKRIKFKEVARDTVVSEIDYRTLSDLYGIKVQLYLDIVEYGDSLQVITEAILDPYHTFYKVDRDEYTDCFVNMYFDLHEMERRQLMLAIETSDQTTETINRLHAKSLQNLKSTIGQFTDEVQFGRYKNRMKQWNRRIVEALGVDNIAFFELYMKKKEVD